MHLKLFFPALFLLSGFFSQAQENYIKLTKSKGGRQKILKEGERIKIKTFNGKKYIGKFTIIDPQTISLNDQIISLGDIVLMKRKSAEAAVVSIFFYVLAGVSVTAGTAGLIKGGWGLIATIIGYPAGTLFAIAGALINDFPNSNKNSKWRYKIIYHE